jgi:hypothetical protein
MEKALKIMNQMQPRKIDLAAKWLQVWEAETDKADGLQGIVPDLQRFINEAKRNIQQHGTVAEKMKPFIDSAKELGAENIVADIYEQLQVNKREAQSDLRLIQALERALQIVKEN